MKIIKLEAENVKRLKAISITPDGNLVVIGGENEAGKSSVLDSIQMVLGGESSIPPVPVRRGESKAVIVAKLDDLTVKRTFTAKGSYLTVENADGSKPKSPQAILDALVGKLSFDPLEFSRMDRVRQAEVLRELVGLDFGDLDSQRKDAYDERTLVNRDLKAAQARLKAAPEWPSVEAANTKELLAKLDAIRKQNANARSLKDAAERAAQDATRAAETAKKAAEEAQKAKAKALAAANLAKSATLTDDAPLAAQILDAEETNKKARENEARAELVTEVKTLEATAAKFDKAIETCDEKKAKMIAAAKMPLPGLAVDSDGVTLDGLPFQQASSAKQLRASVAIGLALNPKLKVLLIRDGSLLDNNSMKALAKQAAEADAQVWIERVGKADASAIIIEDGSVLGAEVAEEEEKKETPKPAEKKDVGEWEDI